MLQWYSDWSFSTSKETRPQTSATSKLYEKGKYFTSISNHSQPLPTKFPCKTFLQASHLPRRKPDIFSSNDCHPSLKPVHNILTCFAIATIMHEYTKLVVTLAITASALSAAISQLQQPLKLSLQTSGRPPPDPGKPRHHC